MRFAVLLLALMATPALGQQAAPVNPALLPKLFATLQAQRNQALDTEAMLRAQNDLLSDELAKARARIAELEAAPKEPKE